MTELRGPGADGDGPSHESSNRRTRKRRTRLSVRLADKAARALITIGGLGTIAAVALICVFLVYVVVPLFLPGSLSRKTKEGRKSIVERHAVRIVEDEYGILTYEVFDDGEIELFRTDTGALMSKRRLFAHAVPTSFSFEPGGDGAAFGFADGTARVGSVGFETTFLDPADVPASIRHEPVGKVVSLSGGAAQMTPSHQFRLQRLSIHLGEPFHLTGSEPVAQLDFSNPPGEPEEIAAVSPAGRIRVVRIRKRTNLLTGKTTVRVSGGGLELPSSVHAGAPDHLLLSGIGHDLYAIWNDGTLLRVNVSDLNHPFVAERQDLFSSEGTRVTATSFLVGKTTFLVGDTTGRVTAYFPARPANAETRDGTVLVAGHRLPGPKSAVSTLAPSGRSRLALVGYENGALRIYDVTTEHLVVSGLTKSGSSVLSACIFPKEDGVIGLTRGTAYRWRLSPGFPSVTLRALFTPIWYEGAAHPAYAWQSTGATKRYEPKLSLVPLIFGTLKATLYSMLFGLPLALLAAIYTSEFLAPKARNAVKPVIEVMASLPSVVLGFIAALVLAPFVETVVPAVLAAFLTVPLTFVIGAHLWQLLPRKAALRFRPWRLPVICACVPAGVALAVLAGPVVQSLLFAGDIKAWLHGTTGGAFGGWVFLMLPASAVLVGVFVAKVVAPRLRRVSAAWPPTACALLDLGKFVAGSALAVAVSLLAAWLLAGSGYDPRGNVVGTYVQRNALIVGFVMGFAIIPIIFTIAEDALSAVPQHLRSGSLATGATRWQTSMRIVVPTAMSGLFSAVMIGLGRAVGETMIVLMATGNTPLMDWNPFNGFKTLSATLASEFPEAVQGGAHYRTLFLAALVLFLITFVVNTVAESVRLRFRKRAFEL